MKLLLELEKTYLYLDKSRCQLCILPWAPTRPETTLAFTLNAHQSLPRLHLCNIEVLLITKRCPSILNCTLLSILAIQSYELVFMLRPLPQVFAQCVYWFYYSESVETLLDSGMLSFDRSLFLQIIQIQWCIHCVLTNRSIIWCSSMRNYVMNEKAVIGECDIMVLLDSELFLLDILFFKQKYMVLGFMYIIFHPLRVSGCLSTPKTWSPESPLAKKYTHIL